MIAVLAALDIEAESLERRLASKERALVSGFRCTLGHLNGVPVLVCKTGMGRRAGDAATAVMERYRPEAVLSVGLGGALRHGYGVGDLAVCERVGLREEGQRLDSSEQDIVCDKHLAETARLAGEAFGTRLLSASCLTVGAPVADVSKKAALAKTGFDVVDMESYWVGKAASMADVPFLAIRAISDGPRDRLPLIHGVVSPSGDLRAWRALAHIATHPESVPLILRTGKAQLNCRTNIARFLDHLLASLPLWSAAERRTSPGCRASGDTMLSLDHDRTAPKG